MVTPWNIRKPRAFPSSASAHGPRVDFIRSASAIQPNRVSIKTLNSTSQRITAAR
jgi:hypothetical protein